jgi:Protein of unknown function DUF262/Protein of unknown function (DUF1524)
MTTKIEAQERNIGDIFSDLYQFEIPPYQRPYAWEEEQARELLDDLLDAMDNRDASGGLYFLGSIVLVKLPAEARARVIDGQQRLTTLTILLSVLRDLTTDLELKIERRSYVYQRASADKGLKDRYRLLLRERDRPFFLKYVQSPGATDNLPDVTKLEGSQQRIAENAKTLRTQLEGIPEERRNALIAFLIQHSYLVVVAVPTAEAARRIFTVLNARGLDLTPTDILKADLLERAGSSIEASLANRWEEVEQALGRERMVALFAHIRMIYERDKPRLALEAGFPKFVPPFTEDADAFISNVLEPLADAWLLLTDTARVQKHFGSEAAKAVRSLDRIDNKDWVPPALLRMWKWEHDESSAIAGFLIALERLAYFLFVTRAGVNDRIGRFSAVMDEFEPRKGKETPTDGLSPSDPEQQQFVRVISGPLYQASRVCKPVMQRLDEALSSGGASYDELVSIEHVLPQTVDAGSEWALLFPDEQERSDWTHRLANLVFLTHRINTRASNWDFERKKKEYFASSDGSSPFIITQGVLQAEKWTPEYLRTRQRQLVEKLCEVWQLNAIDVEEEQIETISEKGTWEFTDSKIIVAKREKMMEALGRKEGVTLNKKGALCWTNDKVFRAVCTVSKRYSKQRPYWYGYSAEWRKFLSEGQRSFLVFGCVDRDTAYSVPAAELEKIIDDLHRTPDKHWHVVLDENETGGLDLVCRSGLRLRLDRYELKMVK